MKKKMLIIRFSSFGDVIHTRASCAALMDSGKIKSIDWLIRSDLVGALEGEAHVEKIIAFDRKLGFFGLIKLARQLVRNEYDLVYDAHNNVRSLIVRTVFRLLSSADIIIRPKERIKRLLLFKFGKNLFPKPYKAMESYWRPLKESLGLKNGLSPINWPNSVSDEYRDLIKNRIVLVPATAWPMKSWPVEHWQELVRILPERNFLILGGPDDSFCNDIEKVDSKRVLNLAGKLSLKESSAIAASADFLISADTGLQQVADLAGVEGISLMGPSAFGFTTMGKMKTLEIDLPCRPCSKDGRGSCSQEIYQRCMVEITPAMVAQAVSKRAPSSK